jgi:hypothetical protein
MLLKRNMLGCGPTDVNLNHKFRTPPARLCQLSELLADGRVA